VIPADRPHRFFVVTTNFREHSGRPQGFARGLCSANRQLMLKPVTTDIEALKILDERLRWLSAWTIHHANHIRDSADGLKVGGHQASCASMTAIMAALYFHALGPNDRVAVKPHAGPVLHAIHYLLGSQSREALENFRGLGGAQSYPSRTKDKIPVDFSTGSVGLGVAITLFASLVQDYLTAHGWLEEKDRGRFVALIGDAELDEGNIYEAIIEGYKHDVRNLWWIIDYNRQSLDATSADRMFERFDEIFRSCGWRVVELRYGKRLQAALDGNKALKAWFEQLSNAELSALHYQGGAAWRARVEADLGKEGATKATSGSRSKGSATMRGRASRPCSSAAASPARSEAAASARSPCPQSPHRQARSNRPRRRSAGSCSTSPRRAASLPIALSPPRPT
jgi:pyruvate dehydrogenase complex dehydrogenase (E1) component